MDVLLPVEVSDPKLNPQSLQLLHPWGGSHLSLPVQHLPSFPQGFYIQGNGRLSQTFEQE